MRLTPAFGLPLLVATLAASQPALPTTVDVFANGSSGDACSDTYAAAVATRLQSLLLDHGELVARPDETVDPLVGSTGSQYGVIAKVIPPPSPAPAVPSPCPSVIPAGYMLRWTLIDRTTNHFTPATAIQLGTRDVSRPIFLSEFIAAIPTPTPASIGVPRARVQIVIVQEGATTDSDSQTANTAFSAPAFLESRLVRDLAVFQYSAMTVNDYFKSLSAVDVPHSRVPTTTEEQKDELCKIKPDLVILRYDLKSSQSTNVWTGAQRGNAVAAIALQACPETQNFAGESQFGFDLKRQYFTTKGTIFPQAVLLANFLLGSGRKDFIVPSFLGSGKIVAASFLAEPDTTAAHAAAVGEVSRYVSCRTYVELTRVRFNGTRARIMNDDRERAPCPVANVVSDYLRKVDIVSANARPPSSRALDFGSRPATDQMLGHPATRPYVSPPPSPAPQ